MQIWRAGGVLGWYKCFGQAVDGAAAHGGEKDNVTQDRTAGYVVEAQRLETGVIGVNDAARDPLCAVGLRQG